jgi:hypothetical protein
LPKHFLKRDALKLEIFRVQGHQGWRAVTDVETGDLVATWRGRAPETIRAILKGKGLLRSRSGYIFTYQDMLNSCAASLKAWLFDEVEIELEKLVCREGYLEVTNTHFDAVFRAELIDLNIRRWGLDISPAWCPWLFKVVTIHYDFGQQIGGQNA